MPDQPQPWDKLQAESLEAYARFRCFLALGPGRTIPLAQRAMVGAREGKKSQSASGQWNDDSAKHSWQSRAAEWDIYNLSKRGEELAMLWVDSLVRILRKTLEKLLDPRFKPKAWRDVTASATIIGQHLSPEMLAPILARLRQQEREPDDSCSLDRFATPGEIE